ncbi:RNA polymerase sigma factor [Thermosulfurimonas sp. F29]|uniref:RNA polymerase sigma factor n=1 Tax=Thermosulfurimonas sp. F29 TaxID=2867247 RepID=UPI001C8373C9|nr:sigma-70 family RNA polymerase sigma factor [Thermosulfurimonas sp. F29]MBX6423520.1 sigma-70 family RNA polymerase sigma factor [Thermosulfurimonas sp. F29]
MIEDLLRRLAEGDEGALKELYELTGRRVWSYIWRLCGDREMADELTVMTYTEVWRSAPGFRGESKALTWIYAIARRLTYRTLRGRRMEEDPEEGENSPVSEEDPFRECLRLEIRALVRKALEALPLKHREVLDLVFLHGLTYEEIAGILNIPVNTVKTRVFHARKKLRKILEGMGVKRDDVL